MFEANGSTVAIIQDGIVLIVLDLVVESGLIDNIATLGILEKKFQVVVECFSMSLILCLHFYILWQC